MNELAQIPFRKVMDALLDEETPFNPRYLVRFTDLDPDEALVFNEKWPFVSVWRRKALMEDLETLHETDYLLSFEAVGRLVVQDEDPSVRAVAVRLLWEYESNDLIEIFLSLMENDSDSAVRAAAAQGLGRFIYEGELEELPEDILRTLEDRLLHTIQFDESTLVRRKALESMGFSSREEMVGLIETAYATGNREWLASALYAMGRSANQQWEERIISMLESPFPVVRTEAARAAGELELREAVEGLFELLEDDNLEARYAAIWSLSQIGGEGIRDVLEGLVDETEDEDEVEFIEEALENLSFTEDLELFTMFDLPSGQALPDGENPEELELLDLIDEYDLDIDNED
jgi:hypothetical protein